MLTDADLDKYEQMAEEAHTAARNWARPFDHIPTMEIADKAHLLVAETRRLRAVLADIAELSDTETITSADEMQGALETIHTAAREILDETHAPCLPSDPPC